MREITWPSSRDAARLEDMSPNGHLRVSLDEIGTMSRSVRLGSFSTPTSLACWISQSTVVRRWWRSKIWRSNNSENIVSDLKLPVDLPSGWTAEANSFGVLIEARNADGRIIGGMTVDEKMRGYTPGIARVRASDIDAYCGRGWKEALYRDAIDRLITITGWRG